MPMHSKTCELCGDAFTSRWRKTLYCEECQILRALNWGLAACNCSFCERKYWPLKRTHTQCPDCNTAFMVTSKTVTPCPTCTKRIRTAPGMTKACLSCVTKDEFSRKQYRKHLRWRYEDKLKKKETV